jgi:GNAT superfamily N-acetyltransferase
MNARLDRLEALADQNLVQSTRIHSRWQPAAKLLELNGVLLHQGTLPLPTPYQNCVLRLDQAVRPEQLFLQAEAFFGGAANPYAVITQSRQDLDLDAYLATQGFLEQANLPTMLIEAPVKMPDIDNGIHIDLLTQAQALPAFIQVCARAYESLGLPPVFTPSFFVDTEAMMTPDAAIVLARDAQGQALACAMALHTGPVAGVYWVGAVPEARGRGLAAACTAAVTNLALEKGAQAVTLQATHMGEPTYKRLGYREFGRMTRWSR